jgi:hypothetical protein
MRGKEATDALSGSVERVAVSADAMSASVAGAADSTAALAAEAGAATKAWQMYLSGNPQNVAALNATAGAATHAADSTAAAAGATVEYAEALRLASASSSEFVAASERVAAAEAQRSMQMASSSVSIAAAEANLGRYYKTFSKLEKMGTPAIMKAGTWTALGSAGLIYSSVHQFTELNAKMIQITTQAGIAKAWLPDLQKEVIRIGKETGQNFNDIADSMYRVASGTASWTHTLKDGTKAAGASKKQIMELTDAVSKLNLLGNVPGGVQTEQTSRIMTVMLNAGLRDIGTDPKKALRLLNAGAGAGDVRLGGLISGLGRGVLASASATGLTATDALSWMDLMTSMGTTESVAGTYVRSAIINLAASGGKGQKSLAMLGIKPGELQGLMAGKGGLISAAQRLKTGLQKWDPLPTFPKFKGKTGVAAAREQLQAWGANSLDPELLSNWSKGKLTDKQKEYIKVFMLANAFGGAKQLTPILTLIQSTSVKGDHAQREDTIEGIHKAITDHATDANVKRSLKLATDQPQTQFRILKQTLRADLVQIGQTITPAVLSISKALVHFIDKIAKMKSVIIPLTLAVSGFIAVAGLAKLGSLAKGMYAPLGKAYGITDKLWGGLSHIPGLGWTKNFVGKGGGRFRDAALTSDRTALKEAGDTLTKAGMGLMGAAEAIERAAYMGGGAGGRGGRGGRGGGGVHPGASGMGGGGRGGRGVHPGVSGMGKGITGSHAGIGKGSEGYYNLMGNMKKDPRYAYYAMHDNIGSAMKVEEKVAKRGLFSRMFGRTTPTGFSGKSRMSGPMMGGARGLIASMALNFAALRGPRGKTAYERRGAAEPTSMYIGDIIGGPGKVKKVNPRKMKGVSRYGSRGLTKMLSKADIAEEAAAKLRMPHGLPRSKYAGSAVKSVESKALGLAGRMAGKAGIVGKLGSIAAKVGGGSIMKTAAGGLARFGGTAALGGIASAAGGTALGSIAGGALGMLGGPLGMIAMSALMPIAMPYIMKGMGGIGNFVGGLFGNKPTPKVTGPTAVTTQGKKIAAKLTQQEKQLAKDEKELAKRIKNGGNTDEVLRWINRDKRNIAGLNKNMGNVDNAKSFKKIYDKTNAMESVRNAIAHHKKINLADVKKLPKEVRMQIFGKDNVKEYDVGKYVKGSKWYTGANERYLKRQVGAYEKYMGGKEGSQYLNKIDKNYFARREASNAIGGDALNRLNKDQKATLREGEGHFRNNLTKTEAQGKYMKIEQMAGTLVAQAADFRKKAAATTSTFAKTQYKAEAVRLETKAKQMEGNAKKLAAKFHLEKATITDLASAIATANKTMYTSMGLTKQGYIDAFTAAMNGSGGQGLAAAVAKAMGNSQAFS